MKISLPKLLITGGNGQLAQALKHHEQANDWNLIFLNHQELDISNQAAVNHAIKQYLPDMVINTAAYTAVDKAEIEKVHADHANRLGAENLAISCQQQQIPLFHLSTDYVFDGQLRQPYTEEDLSQPINYYGLSKLEGEKSIRKHCERHIILRVSGVFSEYGHNFMKTIVKLVQEKTELKIVHDQILCPTYAGDIASTIFAIAKRPSNWGTYHFCSDTPISWYQFANTIVSHLDPTLCKTQTIHPINSHEFPTLAKRPNFSALDCNKIYKIFGIPQPSISNLFPTLFPRIQSS